MLFQLFLRSIPPRDFSRPSPAASHSPDIDYSNVPSMPPSTVNSLLLPISTSTIPRSSTRDSHRKASMCSPSPAFNMLHTNSGKGIGTPAAWNLAATSFRTFASYAPDLPSLVEGMQSSRPRISNSYGFTGGHIFHGELASISFHHAPLLDWAGYKTPIPAFSSAAPHPSGHGLTAPAAPTPPRNHPRLR